MITLVINIEVKVDDIDKTFRQILEKICLKIKESIIFIFIYHQIIGII